MKPSSPNLPPRVCSRSWGKVIAILVGLHMGAVLAEPLRFFSQSDFQAGPEFLAWRRWTAPYVEWLSLDHGYFFFAPNPGPSHLLGVSTEPGSAAGKTIEDYAMVFPDRRQHWPRLLYHRYFMLSEFYNNTFAPNRLLAEDLVDAEFVARWKQDRMRYEALRGSLASSLESHLEVDRVELHRFERILFTPEQVIGQGWRLDDPRGLILLEEGPLSPGQAEPASPLSNRASSSVEGERP
jgi:hypothetical protein